LLSVATGWREDLKHRTSELPPPEVFAACPERISDHGLVNLSFEAVCVVTALFFPCKVILFLRRMLYVENVKRKTDEGCLCPSFACFSVSFTTCLIKKTLSASGRSGTALPLRS
jgi:hypothetical protein